MNAAEYIATITMTSEMTFCCIVSTKSEHEKLYRGGPVLYWIELHPVGVPGDKSLYIFRLVGLPLHLMH